MMTRRPRAADVKEAVIAATGVPWGEIIGMKRSPDAVLARELLSVLLYTHCGMSFPEIAAFMCSRHPCIASQQFHRWRKSPACTPFQRAMKRLRSNLERRAIRHLQQHSHPPATVAPDAQSRRGGELT